MSMTHPFTVMTVCTGNICRSPMAQIVLAQRFAQAGLSDDVCVESSAISDEEYGHPIDPRAARVLRLRGYAVPEHHAHQITAQEAADSDLILPMTSDHYRDLLWLLPEADDQKIRLYRSFDPSLPQPKSPLDGSIDLVDPWYGGPHDFDVAMDQIEDVAPFIVSWVAQKLQR